MRRGRLRLAFVGSGSPEQAAQYVASLKLPDGIVGELLLDESTEAFGAFNLRKSVYASLVPSIVAGLRTHGLGAVSEGIRLGWKNAALAGDRRAAAVGTRSRSSLEPRVSRRRSCSRASSSPGSR